MQYRSLVYLSVFVVECLSAQSFTFFGTVVDSATSVPLEQATVYVVELKLGKSTDKNGNFSFTLPHGTYTIMCRMLGYEDKSEVLVLSGNRQKTFQLVPAAVKLSEVNVVGETERLSLKASSQSVTMLTSKEIDRHRGQTLGKALEHISGVTLLSTGPSISKPVIRGLHSQRVVLVNAGVQQEGQQWGGEHAPEIDPFVPSRISVLKGAAGIEYGAGAIGGVIRIEPRSLRTSAGIGGILTFNGFSNNAQAAASLLLEGKTELLENVAWRIQSSTRLAGDSRTSNYILGNTGFKEFDGSFAVGYSTEGKRIQAYFSHYGTELGIFRGSHIGNISDLLRAIERGSPLVEYEFTYNIKGPKQNVTHDLWSVNGEYHIPSLGILTAQYGWQSNNRKEYDAHKPFSNEPPTTPSFDLTLTTYSADVKLRHEPVGNFVGTVGVSGIRQGNVRKGTTLLIPNFRAYSGSVFAIEEWVNDNLILNMGMRYDYRWFEVYALPQKNIVQKIHSYSNVTAAGGVIYQFAQTWSLGLNVGTAWRPPSINELYSNDVHHGAAQFEIGNPNLDIERNVSMELTLRYDDNINHGDIGFYINSFDNYIYALPDPTPTLTIRGAFPTFRYTSTNALLYGADGMFDLFLTERFSFIGGFSIVRGDDNSTNRPLINMPADRLYFTPHYDVGKFWFFEELFAEVTVTAVARQNRFPANMDYVDPPPGYVLFGLAFGSNISIVNTTAKINLEIENLFNKQYRDYQSRYRYFADDPGFNVILRLQIPFGNISP